MSEFTPKEKETRATDVSTCPFNYLGSCALAMPLLAKGTGVNCRLNEEGGTQYVNMSKITFNSRSGKITQTGHRGRKVDCPKLANNK